MRWHVRKVAVLGSGVMGSAIAAHFANAGVPSLVLDIVPKGVGADAPKRERDRLASESVRALAKARPAPLFVPERLALIETGNLEDDLARLGDADWVIEAVREDLGIKKKVFEAIAPHIADDAVLSSNTSGLSLRAMAETLPDDMRSRFLGTHFFNPPRYMRLLEIIATEWTDRSIVDAVSDFAATRLGKGVVDAKDTPNFIANRIGVHSLMATFRAMERLELSIEEVDALTGPAMARPKTATFRLADLVGIDTLLYVGQNVHAAVPDDESRDDLVAPDFLKKMVDAGLLGQKSGGGFYKKIRAPRKGILTLDVESLEYREPRAPELPGLETVRGGTPEQRVRALLALPGRTGEAAWALLAPTLSYAAMRLGEIADQADTVDRAMRLGFNWELGPFELWDALGFRETAARLRGDDLPLPEWVQALEEAGAESIYQEGERGPLVAVARPGGLATVDRDPRAIPVDDLRAAGRELERNDSASLLDLGDGILLLEFHSKMNSIDDGTLDMMRIACERAEAGAEALVVGNDGEAFCAGANLKLLVGAAQQKDWKTIEGIVRGFQQANDLLEHSSVPVVVAPHGLALGGGAEVVLAGNAVHAAAESYVGLVEVGAGLVPAGGGCMRLYRRHVSASGDAYGALKATFETIGTATVATSAEDARRLGFLGPRDGWSMNREHLLADARGVATGLARSGFRPPAAERAIPVLGRGGIGLIESGVVNMLEGRFISEHDAVIGRELARILSGGDVAGPTTVSAQHILDLELESFLRLCGEPKTQERIVHLLKTGKPLRN